jgi:hypothetical protein
MAHKTKGDFRFKRRVCRRWHNHDRDMMLAAGSDIMSLQQKLWEASLITLYMTYAVLYNQG